LQQRCKVSALHGCVSDDEVASRTHRCSQIQKSRNYHSGQRRWRWVAKPDVIVIETPPGEIPAMRWFPVKTHNNPPFSSSSITTTTIIYSSCKLSWPKEAILTTFSKFVVALAPQALCSLAPSHTQVVLIGDSGVGKSSVSVSHHSLALFLAHTRPVMR